MSALGLMAFRLGQHSPESVSSDYRDFYEWVSRKIFGLEHSDKLPEVLKTIPVPANVIHKNPSAIYSMLHEQLDNLNSETTVVIIDFTNSPNQITRGIIFYHLAAGLAAWFGSKGSSIPQLKFILLLPDLPPVTDDNLKYFSPIIDRNRLVIVSEAGTTMPETKDLRSSRFEFHQARARGKQDDLIQKKMVRRHGHFKRGNGGNEYCVPYFFDGRYCESETTALFSSYYTRCSDKLTGSIAIAYHAPLSPWVQNTAVGEAIRRDVKSFDLDQNKEMHALLAHKPGSIFLIVDMIDTGEALQKILNVIVKITSQIRVISVMTTSIDVRQEKVRYFHVGDTKIAVHCILEVKQNKESQAKCEMCRLQIPFNTELEQNEVNEPLKLSAYNMWNIARMVGVEPEQQVPFHRVNESLQRVPRFNQLIDDNGAWIAHKLKLLIDEQWKWAYAPLVLFPSELGAEVLSEHLRLILGWSVLAVPRRVIDRYAKADLLTAVAETQSEPLISQLRGSAQTPIVIMDVFNVSGHTVQGLYNLVNMVTTHKPTGCILLVDLNPSASKKLLCQTLSLYSLQANFNKHE